METKRYTQIGNFSIAVFLILLIFISLTLHQPQSILHIILILTFITGLLFFYKLTILISDTQVSFKFGIGLFGKSYDLSDIKAVLPVRNSWINGIGIRILANGWLYNVSGFQAIELHFKGRSSVVRIGTDRPEEISTVINSMISNETGYVDFTPVRKKRRVRVEYILVSIGLLIAAAVFISDGREASVEVNNSEITISGYHGVTIPVSDVMLVDTILTLPKIDMRTNGYAFGNTKNGDFRLADGTDVKLFVKSGYPPYILLKSKGREPVYINFEDREKTRKLYRELSDIKN